MQSEHTRSAETIQPKGSSTGPNVWTEASLHGLTLMKPRVLDGVLEIQPVGEELGDLRSEDEGTSSTTFVEEALPFACASDQDRTGHECVWDKRVDGGVMLTLLSPFVFDPIQSIHQLGKHVVCQPVIGCTVETDLPDEVGRSSDLEERHGGWVVCACE